MSTDNLIKLGYNAFLDRNIWVDGDPLSGSQKLYGIGSDVLTQTGGIALPLVSRSDGAASSGKIPQLNSAGILDDSFFDMSGLTTFSAEVGENVTENDALYIKSDGKLWLAKNNSTPESSYNFCGFAAATTVTGKSVALKPGPVVDGFSGLTPGRMYYLSSTAGKLTYGSNSSFGGIGGSYAHPVGMALSNSEMLVIYGTSGFYWADTISFAMPAVGASTTATVTPGFTVSYYWGTAYMEASDDASANTTKRMYEFVGRQGAGSGTFYTEVNGAGVPSIGIGSADMTIVPNAGANRSTLTLDTYDSGDENSITMKLTNAVAAGAGSNIGVVRVMVHCLG